MQLEKAPAFQDRPHEKSSRKLNPDTTQPSQRTHLHWKSTAASGLPLIASYFQSI